ncbi:protein maelstrom homolog [Anopheles maculipalpis]|uniref:protein maelstrom homolog n=1 Tax=Anopheles maculipalpis TaxID=1496333 RepID=UPI0021593612|nr:protein maelstrom homolog [Anopheles maculipalpis]
MPKKSAFFWFMLEHRKRLEAKGRRFRCLKDVVPLASEVWKKMDTQKRKTYAKRANEERNNGNARKLNSLGLPISAVDKMVHYKAMKEQMRNDLTDLHVILASSKEDLASAVIFIVAMQYFCRTSKGMYIPAELAVVKYSLAAGVMDELHVHVAPRKIPMGYAYAAMEHAKKTHQLKLPPYALGVEDFDEIADMLITFLAADQKLPLLFTDTAAVPIVENMLESILENRPHMVNSLIICPLAPLFYKLITISQQYNTSNPSHIPSAGMAQEILSLDPHSHTIGISCNYHEEQMNTYNCALSQAIRWTYSISLYCCRNLDIVLIPGNHVPDRQSCRQRRTKMFDCSISGNTADTTTECSLNDSNVSALSASLEEGRLERFKNLSLADMPKSLSPTGVSSLNATGTTSTTGFVQQKCNQSSDSNSAAQSGEVCSTWQRGRVSTIGEETGTTKRDNTLDHTLTSVASSGQIKRGPHNSNLNSFISEEGSSCSFVNTRSKSVGSQGLQYKGPRGQYMTKHQRDETANRPQAAYALSFLNETDESVKENASNWADDTVNSSASSLAQSLQKSASGSDGSSKSVCRFGKERWANTDSHPDVKKSSSQAGTSVSNTVHQKLQEPEQFQQQLQEKHLLQKQDKNTAEDFLTPLDNPRSRYSISQETDFLYDYESATSVSYQTGMFNRGCDNTAFPTLWETSAAGCGRGKSGYNTQQRVQIRGRGRGFNRRCKN